MCNGMCMHIHIHVHVHVHTAVHVIIHVLYMYMLTSRLEDWPMEQSYVQYTAT